MLFILALLVVTVGVRGQQAESAWKEGRATFFGHEEQTWSIHEGSCGFGYQCKHEGNGWNVAAIPSTDPDFQGACGSCYEVKCNSVYFQDNFGKVLDRSSVCYDSHSSVVVKIVDACPCNDNTLPYQAWRWCCGDMNHLDLSVWAFEKLADPKWGLIGIKYRKVECDHEPRKIAAEAEEPTPGMPAPSFNPCLSERFAIPLPTENENQYGDVYQGKLGANWQLSLIDAEMFQIPDLGAEPEGAAMCGSIAPGGTVLFQGVQGAFTQQLSLEFLINILHPKNNQETDTFQYNNTIEVNVGGEEGMCEGVTLDKLVTSGQVQDYTRYNIYLNLFREIVHDVVTAFAANFKGCGGMTAEQVKFIAFTNPLETTQYICIDQVKLLG
eukprot:TRINITY_DN1340_c0_g2_i1.p2 TRINITY_DN1340_c0_g2~~TRINITY_DN1340_c0_g2_i1.p2  ORF type:complete len:438 (-),score=44.92 TRINITY_DN1340_c0_g2_i1:1668-2813(-)